jgi:MiaB/RimO family radical SAM methylthiotransferase
VNKKLKTISLINLGCPKNQVDGERVFADYAQKGYILSNLEDAQFLLINTCAFIKPAVSESLKFIKQASRWKREGLLKRILVMGCLPQRFKEKLKEEYPEIDDLIYRDFVCALEEKDVPRVLSTFPYAYLKIAEGCNRECSFCLIPQLRGKYRSLPSELLLKEARGLREMGIQELVLVAQDTTYWGIDLKGKSLLLELLDSISRIGFPWIRLLYLHPQLVDKEFLISLKSIPGLVPYLDIPLQHVDSRILSLMKRGQKEKDVRQMVELVRTLWPEAVLRSTFIVGFPGEGEKEFQKLLNFLEEARFERLAVFPFYPEEGAQATFFEGQVEEKERINRYNQVLNLQKEIYLSKNKELLGKKVLVLVDRLEGETSIGRTFRDAPEIDCQIKIKGSLKPGAFYPACVTKAHIYSLIGKMEKEGENAEEGSFWASEADRSLFSSNRDK